MTGIVSGQAGGVLYDPDVGWQDAPLRGHVDAWAPPVPGIREVFHARMAGFAYPPHVHDGWGILIVDEGAMHYELGRRVCRATGQNVSLLPPGIVHDGRPAPGVTGFRERDLSLGHGVLPAELAGAAVDRTSLADPELRTALARLHDCLTDRPELLDAQTRLAWIADRIRRHLTPPFEPPATTSQARREPVIAARFRELLDEHLTKPLNLERAAAMLNRSTPHLIRSFTREFGVSPYAYVVGRRIDVARALLLDGARPADVALRVGFYDQAHFTRHFKKHTSTTPARFARSHARRNP
jgi:AraC-like DNA-binding protein